jgi:hypothetical protein
MIFGDPGPCPICDAPHTTCTVDAQGALIVPSLVSNAAASVPKPPPLRAELRQATLPPDEFTTATYKSPRPRRTTRV